MNVINHIYIYIYIYIYSTPIIPQIHHRIPYNLCTMSDHTTSYLLPSIYFHKHTTYHDSLYHDKINTKTLLKYTLILIDTLPDAKFHKQCTQVRTNFTLILLQYPTNIQTIIDALIYHHVSHCLSKRVTLSTDK